MTVDTKCLRHAASVARNFASSCGLGEYPITAKAHINSLASIVDSCAVKIDVLSDDNARLRSALRGMLQLDEENHQRYAGDEDVCMEVRYARAALQGESNGKA